MQQIFAQQPISQPGSSPLPGGLNRQRMIERVRALWLTDVHDHSLYHEACKELGMRRLLQRVGDSYMFTSRALQDYFADQSRP